MDQANLYWKKLNPMEISELEKKPSKVMSDKFIQWTMSNEQVNQPINQINQYFKYN